MSNKSTTPDRFFGFLIGKLIDQSNDRLSRPIRGLSEENQPELIAAMSFRICWTHKVAKSFEQSKAQYQVETLPFPLRRFAVRARQTFSNTSSASFNRVFTANQIARF